MLLRQNFFYPVNRLRGEMDRLFEEFVHEFPLFGRAPEPHGGRFPALNVWEDQNNLYAEAEVPGMSMDDLEVTVLGNELTIKGRRQDSPPEGVTYHRRERGTGSFTRVLRLNLEVNADEVQAHLQNGVLTITLPKAAAAKSRKIEVKASAD